jgi:hypothetical protein
VHLAGDRATALRRSRPTPVVATVRERGTHLDLRTVEPADDEAIVAALAGLGPS